MEQKKTLDSFGNCSEEFKERIKGIETTSVINDKNIDILKKILTKCPNITQLDFRGTRITAINFFHSISKLCPKLKRISFNVLDFSESDWTEFAAKFGPQLTHCSIDNPVITSDSPLNYYEILFKNFKTIKHLEFITKYEKTKVLFYHLKSCKN